LQGIEEGFFKKVATDGEDETTIKARAELKAQQEAQAENTN